MLQCISISVASLLTFLNSLYWNPRRTFDSLTIQTETKVLVTGVGLADEGNDDGLNCDEEIPSQIATSKKILIGMCIKSVKNDENRPSLSVENGLSSGRFEILFVCSACRLSTEPSFPPVPMKCVDLRLAVDFAPSPISCYSADVMHLMSNNTNYWRSN